MESLNKIQSSKILNCYFEKSNNPAPEGAISKDGLKIKRNGEWVYRRQTDKVQKYDLKIGQSYDITDKAGDKVTLTIDELSKNHVIVHAHNKSFESPNQSYELTFDKFYDLIKNKGWQHKSPEEINPSHFPDENQYKTFLSLRNHNYSEKRIIDDKNYIDINNTPKYVSKYIKEYSWQLIDTKKSKISEKTNDFLKHVLPTESYHRLLENNFLNNNFSEEQKLKNLKKFVDDKEAEKVLSDYNMRNMKNHEGEVFLTKEDLLSSYKNGKFYNTIEDLSRVSSLKNSRIGSSKPLNANNGLYIHLGDYIEINRWNSPADQSKFGRSEKARLVKNIKSDKYGDGWQFKNEKGEIFNIWEKYWDPKKNFAGFISNKVNSLIQ